MEDALERVSATVGLQVPGVAGGVERQITGLIKTGFGLPRNRMILLIHQELSMKRCQMKVPMCRRV